MSFFLEWSNVLNFIMAMFLIYIQEKVRALHVIMKRHKNLTPVITGGYFIVGMEQYSYHSNLQWQYSQQLVYVLSGKYIPIPLTLSSVQMVM
jgi:hypothetical protein